ncbi:MAG: hypothetical protein U0Y10_06765 [Spirosomataceae bacterium]
MPLTTPPKRIIDALGQGVKDRYKEFRHLGDKKGERKNQQQDSQQEEVVGSGAKQWQRVYFCTYFAKNPLHEIYLHYRLTHPI